MRPWRIAAVGVALFLVVSILGGPVRGSSASWPSHDIGAALQPPDLVVYDIDGDSDLDVAIVDNATATGVYWFENPGNPSGAWTKRTILSNVFEALAIERADLNGDGRVDLVAAGQFFWTPMPCTQGQVSISWFENPPNPRTDSWPRHAVACAGPTGSGVLVQDVTATDLDGDSDLDIAAATTLQVGDGQVAWFENVGAGSSWTKRVIDSQFDSNAIIAAQVFGDSKPDLFVGQQRTCGSPPQCDIALYITPSDPKTQPFEKKVIDGNIGIALHTGLFATAVDKDANVPDLVVGSYAQGKVVWYAKPTTKDDPWTRREIGNVPNAQGVAAGVVDCEDSDTDVVAMGGIGGAITFFKGPADPTTGTWTPETVESAANGERAISAANLDTTRSGLEVVAGVGDLDKVRWYHRAAMCLEAGVEWLVNSDTAATVVHAGDVTGDGLPEILTAGAGGTPCGGKAELRIWRWDGSTLALKKDHHWPDTGGGRANAVRTGNVDNDPAVEIVTAGYTSSGTVNSLDLRFWRWDGTTFTEDRPPKTGPQNSVAHSVHVGDTDGDAYPEIFVAGSVDQGSGMRGFLQIWEWDTTQGDIVKRAETTWGTTGTAGRGVSAGELSFPPSTPAEVVVGGYTTRISGSTKAQVVVWPWNGVNLGTPSFTEWPEPPAEDNARVYAVHTEDVDGDGQKEVLSAGEKWNPSPPARYESELRIFHWTGTTLDSEKVHSWVDQGDSGAFSIYARSVDLDPAVEILIAGKSQIGSQDNGQLTIFTWDQTTLTEEARKTWITGGHTWAFGVYALDIEPDGIVEVLTGAEARDPGSNSLMGQLRIWNWNA